MRVSPRKLGISSHPFLFPHSLPKSSLAAVVGPEFQLGSTLLQLHCVAQPAGLSYYVEKRTPTRKALFWQVNSVPPSLYWLQLCECAVKIGNGGDRRRQGKWQSRYLYHVGAQRVYLFSRTRNLLFLSAQERGDNSKGLKGDVRKERGRREKSGGSLSVGIWFSMVEPCILKHCQWQHYFFLVSPFTYGSEKGNFKWGSQKLGYIYIHRAYNNGQTTACCWFNVLEIEYIYWTCAYSTWQ